MKTASVVAAEQVGTPRLACRPALTAAALAEHHAIRREVFLDEQSVFVGSDLDEHDRAELTVRLVGYYRGVAAGSVRLFELGSGIWQGDRLAVLAPYRVHGVGAPLVRCAVATAGARGGTEMVAHVQLANVVFFARLGWTSVGPTETYVGLPHQQMRIGLPAPDVGATLVAELAAGIF